MPIYEFQCTKCRHLFEEFFQKLPERPTAKCPECGGKGKKVISNVGIVFKGAGFYVTDSRTTPAKSGATAKAATKSTPESSSSSESNGTDSKSSDSAKPDTSSGSGSSDAKSDK